MSWLLQGFLGPRGPHGAKGDRGQVGRDGQPGLPGANGRPAEKGEKGKELTEPSNFMLYYNPYLCAENSFARFLRFYCNDLENLYFNEGLQGGCIFYVTSDLVRSNFLD